MLSLVLTVNKNVSVKIKNSVKSRSRGFYINIPEQSKKVLRLDNEITSHARVEEMQIQNLFKNTA